MRAVEDGTSAGRGSCGSGVPSGRSRQIRQARIFAVRPSSSSIKSGGPLGAGARTGAERSVPADDIAKLIGNLDARRLHEVHGDHSGNVGNRIGVSSGKFARREFV